MENDNLNNHLDNLFHIAADDNFVKTKENLFYKAVDDNFVDTKENDHQKDEDSGKPLEHKYVTTGKKMKNKSKNNTEELDNGDNNNNNKHAKNRNDERIDNNNSSTSSSDLKETVFILDDSIFKKVNVFHLTKNIKHKILVKLNHLAHPKPDVYMIMQNPQLGN